MDVIAKPHRGPGYGWGSEELDLDAYLARIGYGGDRTPSAEVLRALHLAHVTSIPFENVEVVLDRPVELDVPALQDKLVHRQRGGYCFEHAGLFAAALEGLGFTFTGLLSRVLMGTDLPRPATHAVLLVAAGGASWICDVGFGGSPLAPIEFADDARITEGGWTNRLHEVPATGDWEVQRWTGESWLVMHRFTTNPAYPIDYRVGSHYVATHPRSPFVGTLRAQRIGAGFLHALDRALLSTARPDGSVEEHRLSAHEVTGALAERFGIVLDPDDAAALEAQVKSTPV